MIAKCEGGGVSPEEEAKMGTRGKCDCCGVEVVGRVLCARCEAEVRGEPVEHGVGCGCDECQRYGYEDQLAYERDVRAGL